MRISFSIIVQNAGGWKNKSGTRGQEYRKFVEKLAKTLPHEVFYVLKCEMTTSERI